MDVMEELQKTHVQIGLLFATLLLYLIIKGPFPNLGIAIGIFIAIEIFIMVGLEIKSGAKEFGWEHEVIDTLVALIVAIAIWVTASIMLNTSSPISGVVSCSMLPNLYRGDFVIIQGAEAYGHEISMSREDYEVLTSHEVVLHYNGTNTTVGGSAYSYCMSHRYEPLCKSFISDPETVTEAAGPLTYHYSLCTIDYPGKDIKSFGPCVSSVDYNGTSYLVNYSNNIIVYKSDPGTLFYQVGDIVHRVLFRINVGNETYYLTRGDNNPILDIQMYSGGIGNDPIPDRNVKGKVLFRIPLLGYFKLFIAGFYTEDPQCDTLLEYEHVE